ncbi:MAG: hypothetical protein ABIV28_01945 [Longimicrobiales bacterium]
MLLVILSGLTLSLSPVRAGGPCIDPAAPLAQLALAYNAWPQPATEKSRAAFAELQQYLRSGEDGQYRTALRDYQKLAEDNPGDVHIHLALGVLYASGPDLNPEGASGYRHRVMSHSALADDRASRTLGFVLKQDPSQWIASIALAQIAVGTHEKGRVKQAVDVVQRSLQADPANVTLQLAWSDLLFVQNRNAEALAFWNKQGAGCAGSMHAKAVALFAAGDSMGASKQYLDALNVAGPDELDRFFDDVRVILSDGEPARYNATAAVDRRAWLQLFWERSAARSGISTQSRIAQHMQRVSYADEHYRLASDRSPLLATPGLSGDLNDAALSAEERTRMYEQGLMDRLLPVYDRLNFVPWDDRGVVYVRQGAPDTMLKMLAGAGTRIPRNETWLYMRDNPPWLLTFARDEGPDYYWTYSIGCGTSAPRTMASTGNRSRTTMTRAGGGGGQMEARDFYLNLAQYDERFEAIAKHCGLSSVGGGSPLDARAALVSLRQYYQPLIRTITHTEGAPPKFRTPMRMMTAAYSFRDARGQTEVTALTWIPTPELQDSTPTKRLRLTYTLLDSVSAPLRHDTTVAVPPFGSAGLLRGAVTWKNVGLSGGRLLVLAMNDEDPTRGTQKIRQITIPADGGRTAISDIVVGTPDAAGLLVRGAYRVSPLPDHAITSGSDFRLFYEMYGIAEGANVETTIKVTRNERKSIAELLRLYPGRRDERELTFSNAAKLDSRGIAVQDVAVGGDLLPGAYTILVTVKTAAGEVSRSGALQVDAPARR